MALLDFLSTPVAGQQYAQGPMPSGQAGVPMQGGPTYGNIVQAALKYGSKPGSSAPMFGGVAGKQFGGQPGQGGYTGAGANMPVADALKPLADQPGSILPAHHGDSSGSLWSALLTMLLA